MEDNNDCGCMKINLSDSYEPKLSHGLAAIGSATGLIYGITQQKRWWMVGLLMIAGAGLGRGIGYVVDSKNTPQ